jgi:probable HAF family extracellular repeat protein
MQDIGQVGLTADFGMAINANGWITGTFQHIGPPAFIHPFLWNGSTMQDLDSLGGSESVSTAISDNGWVTGWSYLAGNTVQHAFVWNGSSMQDLGTLGGTGSQAYAINSSGWVTGWAAPTDGYRNAFLWDGSSMQDPGEGADITPAGGSPGAIPTVVASSGTAAACSHR